MSKHKSWNHELKKLESSLSALENELKTKVTDLPFQICSSIKVSHLKVLIFCKSSPCKFQGGWKKRKKEIVGDFVKN
jgi:hypothetical protein